MWPPSATTQGRLYTGALILRDSLVGALILRDSPAGALILRDSLVGALILRGGGWLAVWGLDSSRPRGGTALPAR